MRKSRNKIDIVESGVARRIREIRKAHNSHAGNFAKSIMFSGSTVSEIETGAVKPSLEFLCAFSEKTNANIHWILTGKGPKYLNVEPVTVFEDHGEYRAYDAITAQIVERLGGMDEWHKRDVLRHIDTQEVLDELLARKNNLLNRKS